MNEKKFTSAPIKVKKLFHYTLTRLSEKNYVKKN